MIELRWIEHQERCERTLQYRVWQVRLDAGGAITPLPNFAWSDWQDVPVMQEA